MPKLEQGIPRYESRTKTIYIPVEEDWYRYYDPGQATAHEIGHWKMGHKGMGGLNDLEIIQRELEATLWGASKRGLTPEDEEHIMALRDEAANFGCTTREFVKMLNKARRTVELHNEV